jgi:anti-sigma B factor antagonist
MELKRDIVDGIPVIGLAEPAEIDISNAEAFKQAFEELLQEDDRQVVLDASRVEFFDSAGMGSLLTIQKRLKVQDGQIAISGLNRSVAEVFHMVGFDVVFVTLPDVGQAVRHFKS